MKKLIKKEQLNNLINKMSVSDISKLTLFSISSIRRMIKFYNIKMPKYVQSIKTRNKRSNSLKIAHIKNPELGKIQTRGIISKKGLSFIETYGIKKAHEMIEKLRQKRLGTKQSDLTKLKKSKSLKNRIFSQKTLDKMSLTRKNKIASGDIKISPLAGFGNGGYMKDIGHYVRSSYEHYFAKLLKKQNIRYEYEPKTFNVLVDNEKLSYTPDFLLTDINEYIEIKNAFNANDVVFQKKIKSFKELYPDEKITVLIGNRQWNPATIMKNQEDLVEILVELKPLAVIKG